MCLQNVNEDHGDDEGDDDVKITII